MSALPQLGRSDHERKSCKRSCGARRQLSGASCTEASQKEGTRHIPARNLLCASFPELFVFSVTRHLPPTLQKVPKSRTRTLSLPLKSLIGLYLRQIPSWTQKAAMLILPDRQVNATVIGWEKTSVLWANKKWVLLQKLLTSLIGGLCFVDRISPSVNH